MTAKTLKIETHDKLPNSWSHIINLYPKLFVKIQEDDIKADAAWKPTVVYLCRKLKQTIQTDNNNIHFIAIQEKLTGLLIKLYINGIIQSLQYTKLNTRKRRRARAKIDCIKENCHANKIVTSDKIMNEPTTIQRLLNACEIGDVGETRIILSDSSFDPSSHNNQALAKAIIWGHIEVINLLLQDERIRKTTSPEFIIALSQGNAELESYLKEHVYTIFSFCNNCPICLDKTDNMFTMSCLHDVHLSCVEGMIKKECPICRQKVTNWPKETLETLNENVKEYKHEVIQEEQEQIRLQHGLENNIFGIPNFTEFANILQNMPALHDGMVSPYDENDQYSNEDYIPSMNISWMNHVPHLPTFLAINMLFTQGIIQPQNLNNDMTDEEIAFQMQMEEMNQMD